MARCRSGVGCSDKQALSGSMEGIAAAFAFNTVRPVDIELPLGYKRKGRLYWQIKEEERPSEEKARREQRHQGCSPRIMRAANIKPTLQIRRQS